MATELVVRFRFETDLSADNVDEIGDDLFYWLDRDYSFRISDMEILEFEAEV